MAARKFRNRWWVDFRHNYTRYRKKSPENSRAGAQAYEAVLRSRLARGEDIDARPSVEKGKTFEQFAWEWFETYVKANNKPSAIDAARSILRHHVLPRFGSLPLDAIDAKRIEAFKAEQRSGGYKNQTINNHLNVISGCLRAAVEWAELERAPVVRRLPPPPIRTDFLDLDECHRLLSVEQNSQWHLLVLLAMCTGVRVGELLALDWAHVDFTRGRLRVEQSLYCGAVGTPKNGRSRTVPLPMTALNELHARRRAEGSIFRRADGSRLTYHTAAYHLKRLCRLAGVRPIAWHRFRHTYASQLVQHLVPEIAVKALLGHQSIVTTQRYTHVASSQLPAAALVVDAMLFGNPSGQPAGNPSHNLRPTLPAGQALTPHAVDTSGTI